MALFTEGTNNNEKLTASGDNVQPWYKLLGMSLVDVYEEFPESMWDILGDSPDVISKKDQEQKRSTVIGGADFDNRFAVSIVFDKTLYKYVILGCKSIADKIMNEGLISSCHRDTIIHSLERIENDIELEKFKWIDGADVHANIVEALVHNLGGLPKDLAVGNKCDSCLMILEMWCKNSIDQLMTQMKQLQVALVSLAIRNGGLVLPGNRKAEGNTLMENVVMPILPALEHDASDLRYFRGLIYSSSSSKIPVRCNGYADAFSKCYTIDDFTVLINYHIPDHLIQLLEKFVPWSKVLSEVETYDKVPRNFSPVEQTRDRGYTALSKCLTRRYCGACSIPQDCEIEDAKYHFFSSAKVALEMLSLSIQCVNSIPLNLEKLPTPLRMDYDDAIKFAHFLTSNGIALETAYAVVHLCLEKQLQPSELNLDELSRINFPREHVRGLLQDKGNVFHEFTCGDMSKGMIRWCCKLLISPEAISNCN
ncbi:unnamed protein product [Alopecurus aequalis]